MKMGNITSLGGQKIGAITIYVGAHRRRVVLGIDERLLIVACLIAFLGIASPPCFAISALVYFIGRALTARFPYFIDDFFVWCYWRGHSQGRPVPDDVFSGHDVGMSTRYRSIS